MNLLIDEAVCALRPEKRRFWTIVVIAAFLADLALAMAVVGDL